MAGVRPAMLFSVVRYLLTPLCIGACLVAGQASVEVSFIDEANAEDLLRDCDRGQCKPVDVLLLQTGLQVPHHRGERAGLNQVEQQSDDLSHVIKQRLGPKSDNVKIKAKIAKASKQNETESPVEINIWVMADEEFPSVGSLRNLTDRAIKNITDEFIKAEIERQISSPPASPFDVKNLYHQLTSSMGYGPNDKWIYAAIASVYAVACLVYEIHATRKEFASLVGPEEHSAQAARLEVWDLAKFILQFFVVGGHIMLFIAGAYTMPMWTNMWMAMPFIMPGLVFISGVFSGTAPGSICLSPKSLLMTVIGTPCTLLTFDLLISFMTYITPGLTIFQLGRSGVEWYLECMLVWRLTLPSFFSILRRVGIPREVSFVFVYVASYTIWCAVPYPANAPLGAVEMLRPIFPWRGLVYQAPFFSLGLLRTSSEWTLIFCRRNTVVACLCVMAVYYFGMNYSVRFRELYDTACAVEGQCHGVWWPRSVEVGGLNLDTFGIYSWVFLQKAIMTLSVVPFCVAVVAPCKAISPKLTKVVLGLGSRTFYCYLLHWAIFIVPACRTGLADYLQGWSTSRVPLFRWRFFVIILTVHLTLCSRLTELAFGFLLKTPIWIAEAFGVMPAKKQEEKASDAAK